LRRARWASTSFESDQGRRRVRRIQDGPGGDPLRNADVRRAIVRI
jgi:hypothetical protein